MKGMAMKSKLTNSVGLLVVPVMFLVGCSEQVEQSSEQFSSAANVHNREEVVVETRQIDQLLIEQNRDGNWSASVFDTDAALLERDGGTPSRSHRHGYQSS